MSIALTRTRARIQTPQLAAEAETECAACGSAMEARPNPYFGTGLAIHRYVALCTGCYHVAFVPEPEGEATRTERFANAVRSFFSKAA